MFTPRDALALRGAPLVHNWVSPSLTGGTNVGAGYQGVRYCRLPGTGLVCIQGWFTVANTTATTLFTLPAGYRSAAALAMAVPKFAAATYTLVSFEILATGEVRYPAGLTAGNALYINSITFPADV